MVVIISVKNKKIQDEQASTLSKWKSYRVKFITLLMFKISNITTCNKFSKEATTRKSKKVNDD